MNLFDMTESQLDEAVQAHYNNMYDQYYGVNEPERCCENCIHYGVYADKCCSRLWDNLTKEEEDQMLAEDDLSPVMKDPDDYCDNHEFHERDYEGG